MRDITLPIPDAVTSTTVVATDNPVDDPSTQVRDLLQASATTTPPSVAPSVVPTALEMLDALQLRVHPRQSAHHSPWKAQLAAAAADEATRGTALEAAWHIAVITAAPPAAQPLCAQAARLTAHLLTDQLGGATADLSTNEILSDHDRADTSTERFILGDHWLPVFMESLADNSLIAQATTAGLGRFGLPELTTTVPAGLPSPLAIFGGINLLRIAAYRLLTEYWQWLAQHPHATQRTISPDIEVDPADLWRFWGVLPPAGMKPFQARLAERSAASNRQDDAVAITPPSSHWSGISMWWRETLARHLPTIPYIDRRSGNGQGRKSTLPQPPDH